NVFRGRRQRGFESFGRAPAPISLALTGPQWIRTSCLGSGSACQAGEPCRRLPAAVRAPRRELRWGDAEDSGKPLDLPFGESPLPAIAAAFGGTHGGVAQPAHQFTELGLVPAVLLAKDPDVRADDSS